MGALEGEGQTVVGVGVVVAVGAKTGGVGWGGDKLRRGGMGWGEN